MSEHTLFDRNLIAKRRMTALKRAQNGADFLMKAAADDLQDRLDFISREFETGIDLGGHTGHVFEVLKRSGKVKHLLRADLFAADPNLSKPDMIVDDAVLPFAPEA